MGRLLLVTWEGGGNIPPALALGARLAAVGHDVTVLGPKAAAEDARAAGLRFTATRVVPAWPAGVSLEDDDDGSAAMLSSPDIATEVVDAVARQQPDTLVVDCMMGAALTAAEHVGLPTVVLCHVLYQPYVTM